MPKCTETDLNKSQICPIWGQFDPIWSQPGQSEEIDQPDMTSRPSGHTREQGEYMTHVLTGITKH